jgi:universal stress protein E
MTGIQRILVAVGTMDDSALLVARAAALGRSLGAALRLASCVYEPYGAGERFGDSPDLAQARAELVDARRAALEQVARPLRDSGLLVSVAACWAYPVFDGLAAQARAFDAQLVIAGLSHPSMLQRLAFAHGDWELIRNSPCPVLFTRGGEQRDYHDILVPVDPMHAHDKPAALDDVLIRAAQALARPAGARLHLLHCYLPAEYVPFRAPGAVSSAAFHRRASSLEAHRDALQQLAGRHGIEAAQVHLEPADACHAIPQAAARFGADLVVMGAVARSRLQRLLIGSTAAAVLDRLPCDVLAVKPPAAAA